MTELTDEEVKALLDGTTPGPWRAVGSDICVGRELRLRHLLKTWRTWDDAGNETTAANAALSAAAPDLARALLAARAELAQARADAQAAVALVVARAADIARVRAEQHADMALNGLPENARLREAMEAAFTEIRWAIRALADADGLAAVEALRKDRDARAVKARGE